MSDEEVRGGRICDAAGCTEFDFLPTHCVSCGGHYCNAHAQPEAHSCTADAPAVSADRRLDDVEQLPKYARLEGDAGLRPEEVKRCRVCGVASGFTVTACSQCGFFFCLDHRFHEQHAAILSEREGVAVDRIQRVNKEIAKPGTSASHRLKVGVSRSGLPRRCLLLACSVSDFGTSGTEKAAPVANTTVNKDGFTSAFFHAELATAIAVGKVGDVVAAEIGAGDVRLAGCYQVPLASLKATVEGDVDRLLAIRPDDLVDKVVENDAVLILAFADQKGSIPEAVVFHNRLRETFAVVPDLRNKMVTRALTTGSTSNSSPGATPDGAHAEPTAESHSEPSPPASANERTEGKEEPETGVAVAPPHVFDDSGSPHFTASLASLKLTNTKLKPAGVDACKGVMKRLVVVVYPLVHQSAKAKAPRPPYCLAIAGAWPMGKVLDRVVDECGVRGMVPVSATAEDQFHLFDLKDPGVRPLAGPTVESATHRSALANADAVALFPGSRIPLSVVKEVSVAMTPQENGKVPKETQLRMMKDCCVM